MEELSRDGLGAFKCVKKLKVFYKKAPSEDLRGGLSRHGISLEDFTSVFEQEDNRLTSLNRDDILENNPNL